MVDGVSNDPVIASLPTPISVEPRTVAPAEAAEVARQAEEAKLPSPTAKKDEPAAKTDEKAKPLSIRESLAKAREKLDAEPVKAISVAAKEPVAKEAAEPVAVAKDAKVEPAAAAKDTKEAPVAAPVARAEDGKFVSTKAPEVAAVAKDAPVAAAEPAKPAALPSHTASAPPARFSQAAKDEWATAPESVRAEAERAIKELTAGHEKHRAAAERDASLNEYHEMAAKGGTDVKTALSKYVGMEQLLRKDPIAGLHEIAKNAGLNLRDVAAKLLNQPADEVRSAADATIRDLTARLEKAEAAVGSIHAERQAATTNTTTALVTQFAADPANSRFEELSDDIVFFMKSGRTKDLAEAYKLAERLNPAPATLAEPAAAASSAPAAVTKPTLVPASTAGEKSIAGTPTAGSDPVSKVRSSSIKEAIRRAAARAG